MSNPIKERITTDLKQVKEVGQVRTDRVREIIRSAASQLASELKAGSGELRGLVKDIFSSAISGVQTTGNEAKEEVTAMVEGIVDGISSARQSAIAKTEAEVKQLQAKLAQEEEDLEQQVENSLAGIREAGEEAPANIQAQIDEAIDAIKNSEEVFLLKRRYAQLQAQAAILRANLAAQSETYYDRAREHLEDAKGWYSQARPKAEQAKDQADEQFAQLDAKLGEAGTALAQRERRVRQILSDLLHRAAEVLKDDPKPSTPTSKLPPANDRALPPEDL